MKTPRSLAIGAAVCVVPIILVLGLKMGLRDQYGPKSVEGCYLEKASPVFTINGTDLSNNGQKIATAKLSFFKQEPFLSIDPGIDISSDGKGVQPKPRGFPENYPIAVAGEAFSVAIVTSNGERHVLEHRPAC